MLAERHRPQLGRPPDDSKVGFAIWPSERRRTNATQGRLVRVTCESVQQAVWRAGTLSASFARRLKPGLRAGEAVPKPWTSRRNIL